MTRYLRQAMFDFNDWLTEEYCDTAIKTLLAYSSSSSLMQINREKYEMLRDASLYHIRNQTGR